MHVLFVQRAVYTVYIKTDLIPAWNSERFSGKASCEEHIKKCTLLTIDGHNECTICKMSFPVFHQQRMNTLNEDPVSCVLFLPADFKLIMFKVNDERFIGQCIIFDP